MKPETIIYMIIAAIFCGSILYGMINELGENDNNEEQ